MKVRLKEYEAFWVSFTLVLVTAFIVHSFFLAATENIISSTEAINNQYKKAYQLYLKIKSNKKIEKKLKSSLLLFVQKLQNINDLGKKIVGASLAGDNTLHLRLTSLNLNDLIGVLKAVESYNNIDIVKFSISRSFTAPDKADMILVLRKKQ